MSITRQQAAAARAAAAKTADAKDRLSALEVERNGYVQRGDKKGIKAVDEEIAHWSRVAGIPLESGEDHTGATGNEGGGEGSDATGTGEQTSTGDTDDESAADDPGNQEQAAGDEQQSEPAPQPRGRAKAAAAPKA